MQLTLSPIATVREARVDPVDDRWAQETAWIELHTPRFTADALLGLQDFSHLEVVYFFHRVPPEAVVCGTRHPRGRQDWPRVGIFAQRAKSRPNRLGLSRCRLLSIEGTRLKVQGLDAIEGTPILDIKPYLQEFGPRGTHRQPKWATALMASYY